MKAHERLLKYVSYRTPSDENSDTSPSSRCQFELAHELVNELKALGVADAECDEYCYVYGHIPATPGKENATAIGFCAHMDTVSDYCDHDANPQIVENYDGEALPLGDSGLVLDPEVFPHLKELKGRTLITTDAKVYFKGENVHPGSAKDVMINAALVAMEFDSLLPAAERPERTEDHEGFYHLTAMSGTVSDAALTYIIRDHDASKFSNRQDTIKMAAKFLNERYGEGTVKVEIKEQYRNMAEVLESCPDAVENAKKACHKAGIEPIVIPVRGGTDGANLSFMGLPCPNIGTGGHAFHGPYEHISIEGMEKGVEVITALIKEFAK